jgi:hypothetical protein
MSIYRLYHVDADDHFCGAAYVDCATDDDAVAAAGAVKGDHAAIEVWRGTRFVARVEGSQITASSRPWLCLQGIRHQARAMIAHPCLGTLLALTNCPCSSPDCPIRHEPRDTRVR